LCVYFVKKKDIYPKRQGLKKGATLITVTQSQTQVESLRF